MPNQHEPWPLYAADVVELSDDLLGASGVTLAGPRLRALWSPGVATRFGRPSRVVDGRGEANSWRRQASNIVVCALTLAAVVAGLTRAMLWNGVSRMPRLRA